MSAEFVGFISPSDSGPMPMDELFPETQREVYAVIGDTMETLPETEEPELLRFLVRLDDGREVASCVLRNCNTTQDFYDWQRQQRVDHVKQMGAWAVYGLSVLGAALGRAAGPQRRIDPERPL